MCFEPVVIDKAVGRMLGSFGSFECQLSVLQLSIPNLIVGFLYE